ncbi:MAG: hypothetical protein KAG61_13915 [Bacteriovoracaceae bacterium]|nr:hypothetical protein [Bacteriovoracaceae bacterium]
MSNIKFFEKIAGYPVIIPKKKCHAAELKTLLERFEKQDEIISVTVQLDEVCDKKLVTVLKNMGFLEDEKEHVYCCDLTAWYTPFTQFDESEYEFVAFNRCGISPFLDIALSASEGDIYRSSEYFNTLMKSEFYDPRLWQILYRKQTPVGLVIAHIDDQKVGRIDYIAVSKIFQNEEIGSILHMKGMGLIKLYGAQKYIIELDDENICMNSVMKSPELKVERIHSLYVK